MRCENAAAARRGLATEGTRAGSSTSAAYAWYSPALLASRLACVPSPPIPQCGYCAYATEWRTAGPAPAAFGCVSCAAMAIFLPD